MVSYAGWGGCEALPTQRGCFGCVPLLATSKKGRSGDSMEIDGQAGESPRNKRGIPENGTGIPEEKTATPEEKTATPENGTGEQRSRQGSRGGMHSWLRDVVVSVVA